MLSIVNGSGTTSGMTPEDVATEVQDGITRLNRRLRQVRPLGELTQSQLSTLATFGIHGPMTPTELAEVERVQPPTMTKIVAKLEAKGLVQRAPHPTDRRQTILSATEAGREALAEQRRVKDAWLTRRLAALSAADRETLHAAVEIFRRIAREDD